MEMPAARAKPSPIMEITDASEAPPPQKRLLLPEARVLDPQFIVPDVAPTQIEVALSLHPRFSVVFQALYESFFKGDWESANWASLIGRTRQQISLQIYVCFATFCVFLLLPLFY